jgi:hypothetical protein
MNEVRKIMYVILILMMVITGGVGLSTYIVVKQNDENKEWHRQRENEIEVIKKFIKVAYNIDVDSLVSEPVINEGNLRKQIKEYNPSSRGVVISINRK